MLRGNEKLLAARARIEAICKEYDIGAHVILHTPGFVECWMDVEPSYSKLSVKALDGGGTQVRLRSTLEDYKGDREAQRRDLEATANLVSSVSEVLASEAVDMLGLARIIDGRLGAEHSTLQHVPAYVGRKQ